LTASQIFYIKHISKIGNNIKGGYFKMKASEKNLFWFLIVLVILLQGCAVGNKYNFSEVGADLQGVPAQVKHVAVATSDQRRVILSGECASTYVGMQRAGLGNPWRVNTESGLPLADDLTKAVSESLSKKGYDPLPVYIKYSDDQSRILELLRERKAERSLLFTIKRWESDTYMNIGLEYEIELIVYNAGLEKLASVSVAESKNLPGSFWDPPSAARREVPIAFKKALETLLNDPKVLLVIQ
jgi:hypothetical protein